MNLRKLVIVLLISIPAYSLFGAELKLGDSLRGLSGGLQASDLFSSKDLGLWPENKVMSYKLKDGNLLLVSMGYYPFGVITKHEGKDTFLLDFNGDSVLDCQPEMLFVPPWVIDLTSKGGDSGNTFRSLFAEKLKAFSENTLPQDSPHTKSFVEKLVEIAKNKDAEDRIFVYFDYLHDVLYSEKEYLIDKACLANIESIAAKSTDARCTWLIESIERAYKDNDIELCRKYDNELVNLNATFVPGLYYQYLLETNQTKKEGLKKTLIGKYAEHWMVKDRFLSGK